MACEKGHESTVLVLIQNKANPNLETKVTSGRMMRMIDDSRYMVMIIAVMMIDDADR